MKQCFDLRTQRHPTMKTHSMTALKSSHGDSTHASGSRGCARSPWLLRCLVLALTVALPCGSAWAAAPEPVDLGTAADFGALAGAAISGTGHVKGAVGAVGAIAPAITSTGTIYPMGDPVVLTALDAVATAYNEGLNRTHDVLLSAAAYELGGTTLTPGVYKIGAAATVATPFTLDAEGDPEAVFIIQITGALGTTAATGNVVLTNGAQSANVFWIVEGAVSAGAGTHMEGTILGGAGIAFGAATTLNGRLLAGTAAGTIAMATTISVPVDPSVVGGRVWFDANINGIQDPAETTGFTNVPVALLQLVLEKVAIDLGTAADFGVLAGAAITGTGDVEGDVGSGTGAIAPAITSSGTIYPMGHAVVMAALDDFETAYSDGKSRAHEVELSAAAYELGGTTLTPGVYKIGAAATVATPVTLDAEGDPEAVFIIQIVGALGTTAATGNVMLTNEATSANVFWVVDGAVSLGANSHMEGTILCGATITFGAATTISGRALAGAAAGTIALATTYSPITGAPPVGFPPPIAVGDTVTDADGNYRFEGVQPGMLFVRWDLSSVTNDYRVTEADQGGDDALDSDGVSGDVGGFVETMEFEVLAGTTNLTVDLGLAETLPAIQAAALDDLNAALAAYLLANYYTAGDWTALQTAKTDGDAAIQAATDPAGVAAAMDAALAAMDAVPTVAETLAAAQTAALDDLDAALATCSEADYTVGNWTSLTTAKTNGDLAIDSASDLAGVASALEDALAAMAAVPTIAETLAAAQAAALDDLDAALASYSEANYTAEGWTALTAAQTDGDLAIQAATDLAGVASALNAAVAAMDAVPTFDETMAALQASALDELASALAAYLETNYYTAGNWEALVAAKTDGDTAIQAATDPAGVAAALAAALAAMDAVPTYAESLAAARAAALDDLAAALAAYNEGDYTPENWEALIAAQADGEAAIQAATDLEGVATALEDALAAMDAVPTMAVTPMITAISRTSEGEEAPAEGETGASVGDVTIVLATTPNVPLTLETSTDLQSWIPIATATPDTEVWTFVHNAAEATGPMRFYRAFLNP
ncbi:MAG: DUF3494 domain-containing protein [Opitutae bacterium]|nr:DUF3494 domain-containing protein [Opitutae bacterium]